MAQGKAPSRNSCGTVAAFFLLALLGVGWVAWSRPRILITDRELVAWAEARGASLPGAVVGRACAACPRGLFASKDLKPGEIIMTVPMSLALPITVASNETRQDDASAAEKARDLLIRIHTDPDFNATWGPYWASLPAFDEMLLPELFTEEHLQLLQLAALADAARTRQAEAESVYLGTFNNGSSPPLASVLPEGVADMNNFKHVVALIITRTFSPIKEKEYGLETSYLLSLLDLLNHAKDANVHSTVHKGINVLTATRMIKRGKELIFDYKGQLSHRPDGSIFFYGVVEMRQNPLLCTVDLPPGYSVYSPDDALYDDPASGYVTQAEHDRLLALLEAAPTTEAEDQALLDSGVHTDWRDREILQFRIMRKRALRQALEKLAAALQAGRASDREGAGQQARTEL